MAHTKAEIETVINAVNEEFNQTLNQLPVDVSTIDVVNKLTSLFGQIIGILKVVIQENNVE